MIFLASKYVVIDTWIFRNKLVCLPDGHMVVVISSASPRSDKFIATICRFLEEGVLTVLYGLHDPMSQICLRCVIYKSTPDLLSNMIFEND